MRMTKTIDSKSTTQRSNFGGFRQHKSSVFKNQQVTSSVIVKNTLKGSNSGPYDEHRNHVHTLVNTKQSINRLKVEEQESSCVFTGGQESRRNSSIPSETMFEIAILNTNN